MLTQSNGLLQLISFALEINALSKLEEWKNMSIIFVCCNKIPSIASEKFYTRKYATNYDKVTLRGQQYLAQYVVVMNSPVQYSLSTLAYFNDDTLSPGVA